MGKIIEPAKKAAQLETKLRLVEMMQAGTSWEEAAQIVGLRTSCTSAYRYARGFRDFGLSALEDGRQGHPSKLKVEVQARLVEYCQANPQAPSSELQTVLANEFGISVTIRHLNIVRQALALSRQSPDQGNDQSDIKKN